MRSDDRITDARKKYRIVALALVFCAAVMAPATVPAAGSGHWSIAAAVGLIVLACLAMAVRLVRRQRTTDGD